MLQIVTVPARRPLQTLRKPFGCFRLLILRPRNCRIPELLAITANWTRLPGDTCCWTKTACSRTAGHSLFQGGRYSVRFGLVAGRVDLVIDICLAKVAQVQSTFTLESLLSDFECPNISIAPKDICPNQVHDASVVDADVQVDSRDAGHASCLFSLVL